MQRPPKKKKARQIGVWHAGDDEDTYTLAGELLTQKKKSPKKRRREQRTDVGGAAADSDAAGADGHSAFGDGLPADVLVRIFGAVCAAPGPPAAPRLASVCSAWRAVVAANEPLLWKHADLSYGWCRSDDRVVRRLCQRGAWATLTTLNIQSCANLTDASLDIVAERCPALTALDASGVPFTAQALVAAARALPLRSLALNGSTPAPIGDFDKTINKIAEALAPSLAALSLRSCTRLGSAGIRALLACPALRSLDLTAAGGFRPGLVLPIEAMQHAWPMLEDLRISGLGMNGGWKAFAIRPTVGGPPQQLGFPRLRVCHVALNVMTMGFQRYTLSSQQGPNETVLRQLLGGSAGLTELDSSDNGSLTADTLRGMPFLELRTLLLAGTGATTDQAAALIAQRWGASLTELSLANAGSSREGVTDAGLRSLAGCASLRTLDLSGSAVTTDGVRRFLGAAAGAVQTVKLELCRGLSRRVRVSASGGLSDLREALREDEAEEPGAAEGGKARGDGSVGGSRRRKAG